MGKLKYLFIYFSLLSCTAEFFPEDLAITEPIYVVNGILYPDSTAKIFISKAKAYNLTHSSVMKELDVRLKWKGKDHESTEQLTKIDSFYVSNVKMKTGVTYYLEVITPEGKVIKANTTIPEITPIESTNLLFPAGYMDTETIKGSFMRIFMDFKITQSKQQYFECFIYSKENYDGQNTVNFHLWKVYNQDEIILAEDLPSTYLHAFVFKSSPNSNTNQRLAFNIIEANVFFNEFYPVLLTVSEEYYLYKKSLYRHIDAITMQQSFNTSDAYFPNIFKQIGPVYSNIEGGKGIFAGVSRSEMKTVCNLVGFACV